MPPSKWLAKDDKKMCSKCDTIKDVSEFGTRKSAPDKLRHWCKICVREARKATYERTKGNAWADKNPEKVKAAQRKAMLKHRYKLTVEEFDELLKSQNGKCKLCDNYIDLCVDHDHVTNKVRGLLCRSCNLQLGHLESKGKNWLNEAISYLGWT